MANRASNTIILKSDDREQLDKCRDLIKKIDFETIIPMPQDQQDNCYEWRCDNWGTKWNAHDHWEEDGEVGFSTAWGPAYPIYAKLAELFPTIQFTFNWSVAETGQSGIIEFVDGTIYKNTRSQAYYR